MEAEKTQKSVPGKSRLPVLVGAIGLLTFVLFMGIFSVSMGVFSSSNVAPASQQPEQVSDSHDQEEAGDQYGDFHSSYYEDVYVPEDTVVSDSLGGMSEEDSLAQMEWYDQQKREIQNEWRKLELERAELEKLKHETMTLLDQRKNIEDANTVQMAKLFDSMKAQDIAAILENMTDDQVGMILMKMKKQNASKVLAVMPAERAAKITTQMMNLAEGF
jgi:flagellar motility protein MotE (MotC chaperone)